MNGTVGRGRICELWAELGDRMRTEKKDGRKRERVRWKGGWDGSTWFSSTSGDGSLAVPLLRTASHHVASASERREQRTEHTGNK